MNFLSFSYFVFVLDTSPIAFSIGGFGIYWYGIIYAISLLIAWKIASVIVQKSEGDSIPSLQEIDKFMFVGIVSCIVFARLGHIIFFEPKYYISHLQEIFMLRKGGMSFHGGVIGLIVSVIWFSKKYGYSYYVMSDILAFAGSIGIFLGRIANFINQELYGIVTGVKWAVIFKRVDMLPRHPTQIYESICEGGISFLVMCILWNKKNIGSGIYTFVFLIIYSTTRYIIEFFKDVEVITYFNELSFTVGQILSVVLFVFAMIGYGMKDRFRN